MTPSAINLNYKKAKKVYTTFSTVSNVVLTLPGNTFKTGPSFLKGSISIMGGVVWGVHRGPRCYLIK